MHLTEERALTLEKVADFPAVFFSSYVKLLTFVMKCQI